MKEKRKKHSLISEKGEIRTRGRWEIREEEKASEPGMRKMERKKDNKRGRDE